MTSWNAESYAYVDMLGNPISPPSLAPPPGYVPPLSSTLDPISAAAMINSQGSTSTDPSTLGPGQPIDESQFARYVPVWQSDTRSYKFKDKLTKELLTANEVDEREYYGGHIRYDILQAAKVLYMPFWSPKDRNWIYLDLAGNLRSAADVSRATGNREAYTPPPPGWTPDPGEDPRTNFLPPNAFDQSFNPQDLPEGYTPSNPYFSTPTFLTSPNTANTIGDYYAMKKLKRKRYAETPNFYFDRTKGVFSNKEYNFAQTRAAREELQRWMLSNKSAFVPDIPMDQRASIAKTAEDIFKTGSFDWSDFLQFADAVLPGDRVGSLSYWGQPLGGQEFIQSPTYSAIMYASMVTSLATPVKLDIALMVGMISAEGYINLEAAKLAAKMIQPTEGEKADMFSKYFLWKSAGWWQSRRPDPTNSGKFIDGSITQLFTDYMTTIVNQMNDKPQFMADVIKAKKEWEKGLANYQENLSNLKKRIEIVEQMEKWNDRTRRLYDEARDPYEASMEMLDLNSSYFDEMVMYDMTGEKEQMLNDLRQTENMKRDIDQAQYEDDTRAIGMWNSANRAMNAMYPRYVWIEGEGMGGLYDRNTSTAGIWNAVRAIVDSNTAYELRLNEWAYKNGHDPKQVADALSRSNMFQAYLSDSSPNFVESRVGFSAADQEEWVKYKVPVDILALRFATYKIIDQKFGVAGLPIPPEAFFASIPHKDNYSKTIAGIVSVWTNGMHTAFNTVDPPEWYRNIDPEWIRYDRNKAMYEANLKTINEWGTEQLYDPYGQPISAPSLDVSEPKRPTTQNISDSTVHTDVLSGSLDTGLDVLPTTINTGGPPDPPSQLQISPPTITTTTAGTSQP